MTAEHEMTAPQVAPSTGLLANVDVVVLDIDDTLYLERDYVRSGFSAVGRWAQGELGITGFAERAWAAFEAGARGRIFDEVLASCGTPSDRSVVEAMVTRYREHLPEIVLAHDARRALNCWFGRVALAAITDGPLASQRAKATALKLDRWVPLIVFTKALGKTKGKPHPAAFEEVQNRVGAVGSRCVYIADNPTKDFEAPQQLGWWTVRMRRHLGLHADIISGADVNLEVTSFDELLDVLPGGDLLQPTGGSA